VTPEIAAAWGEVYWLFALQLVAEEARLYQQAGVDPGQPTRPYRVVRRIG
jgi:nitric oxide dioxygenase